MEEFNNELSMLSKYRHPKIVLLIGAVTVPPTLCIVMEYIKDGTLYDLLYKKKINLSDKQKESIVQQLLSVLLYLHNHGIVHRDIKSHNVLIDNFNIKICDFGLARHKVSDS
jgi:serine/threonine protein kinase